VRTITRRDALGLVGLLAGASCRERDPDVPMLREPKRPVADALTPLPLRDVRLNGHLGRKIGLCIERRIFAQDPRQLTEPFRRRQERQCWQTEFWGKWMTSAVAASDYTGDAQQRERLHESVREVLATQTADGYIGNYAPGSRLESWDIWGRKYTLLGLLADGEAAALAGARRLADNLIAELRSTGRDIVTLGLYRGMASSSVLGPIVDLYRLTHEERYLDFAASIVARWYSRRGPHLVDKALAGVPVAQRFPPPAKKKWWSWENGQKAYEMMSCYSGLLQLYRETGWRDCLNAAVRTFESIRDTEITVAGSGSSDECWYGGRARQTEPASRPMETCVAVTWMELCARLLRITGDARYGDEIEKTAYNALAGAMTADGSSFAQYSPLKGVRTLGPALCGMPLNCCVASGPRGIMLLPATAVLMHRQGPAVVLYSSGVWKCPDLELEAKTDYPASGTIEIALRPARPAPFPLRLRIPAWSERTALAVNGKAAGAVEPGTWAILERRWKPGDRVTLELDLRGRILRQSGRAAVLRGPLALATDVRLGPPGPVPQNEDRIALESVSALPGIGMAFASPGLRLCDYASAGNTFAADSRFRVWLPVA
jgi:DUF1680 family protein